MGTESVDILVRLRAEVDEAIAKLAGAKKNIEEIGDSSSKSSPLLNLFTSGLAKLGGLVAGLIAIQKVVHFIADTIKEFADSERTTSTLNATLGIMGVNSQRLQPIIDSLVERLHRFGASGVDVRAGISTLLFTLNDIEKAMVLTEAATKISKVTGDSYEETIQQINRALIGVLPRTGAFAAAVRLQKDNFEEAKTVGDRYNLILAATTKLQTVADTQADTLSLSIKKLSASWRELKEAIGAVATDKLTVPAWIAAFTNALDNLRAALKPTNADILTSLAAQLDNLQAQRNEVASTPAFFQGPKNAQLADLDAQIAATKAEIKKRIDAQISDETAAQEELKKAREAAQDKEFQDFIKGRSDLNAKLTLADAQAVATRTSELARVELKALEDERDRRLALAKGSFADQVAIIDEFSQKISDRRAKAITDEVEAQRAIAALAANQFTKLTGLTRQQLDLVAQGSGKFSEIVPTIPVFNAGQRTDVEAAAKAFETYTNAVTLAGAASEQSADQFADSQTRIKKALDEAVSDIETKLNRELQNIEALKNTGSISNQEALTQNIGVKSQASVQLQPLLAAEQRQLGELNKLVGPLSPEQAAQRQQLIQDVANLQAKIASLKPTLDEEIQQSNDFFEGVSLGARKAANDQQSFGQIGAQTVDTFEKGIAQGGATLFDNLTHGAKNFGATVKQVFADLLRQIAMAIIQSLILKAIQTGLGGASGGGVLAGSSAGGEAQGGVLGYARGGFLGFRTTPGIIQMGTTATADDVPFWGSKGEGIVRASAVNYYGPSIIHALNRFSLPADLLRRLNAPAMPTPQFRFADGGVVGQLAREQQARPGGQPQHLVINNVLSFGEDEGERIGSLSSMREATFAHLESDPDRIARALRGRIR